MAVESALLNLPRELRDQIWEFAFSHLDVVPFKPPPEQNPECIACQNNPRHFIPYEMAYRPLLTCKQIHEEALHILRRTLNLHIHSFNDLDAINPPPNSIKRIKSISTSSAAPLRNLPISLTLHLHLNDFNRDSWLTSLTPLHITFLHLQSLTINSHMRPPLGYDALIDAIHLAGPLVNFTSAHPNTTQDLRFDYISDGVIFQHAFVGVIRTSDTLAEHEAVLRELLADEDFQLAAKATMTGPASAHGGDDDHTAAAAAVGAEGALAGQREGSSGGHWDLHLLTNCLLRIARAHEPGLFERIMRREGGGDPEKIEWVGSIGRDGGGNAGWRYKGQRPPSC